VGLLCPRPRPCRRRAGLLRGGGARSRTSSSRARSSMSFWRCSFSHSSRRRSSPASVRPERRSPPATRTWRSPRTERPSRRPVVRVRPSEAGVDGATEQQPAIAPTSGRMITRISHSPFGGCAQGESVAMTSKMAKSHSRATAGRRGRRRRGMSVPQVDFGSAEGSPPRSIFLPRVLSLVVRKR